MRIESQVYAANVKKKFLKFIKSKPQKKKGKLRNTQLFKSLE